MAKIKTKTDIDVYGLVYNYLISIGVSKTNAALNTLPNKYEKPVYFHQQKKSNVVTANKKGTTSQATHIAISKDCYYMFFDSSEINNYELDGDTRETNQSFTFFEANISDLTTRRTLLASREKHLKNITLSRSYAINQNLLSGSACKWISSNNSLTQLRLSKAAIDDVIFGDFRLGILIDDYLAFFKHINSNNILAVAIPKEFVEKYKIVKLQKPSINEMRLEQEMDTIMDSNYISAIEEGDIVEETSLSPIPSPKPKKAKEGKPKYVAKPAIGRGAIKRAAYLCENDNTHSTFTSRRNGKNYMEPHHLIPLAKQNLLDYNIDITSNIICLCPNCHSQIHYGTAEEIKTMLTKFLDARSADLSACGIDIDAETLFALYEL